TPRRSRFGGTYASAEKAFSDKCYESLLSINCPALGERSSPFLPRLHLPRSSSVNLHTELSNRVRRPPVQDRSVSERVRNFSETLLSSRVSYAPRAPGGRLLHRHFA